MEGETNTSFQYPLMDQMKNRDNKKILPLIELQSRILKIYDFPKYQLSTTDDEENDETEDPIETAKPSPSAAENI